jgi:protein TonB
MFEQAILTDSGKPWTLALSVTLQTAAAGAVVLLSILTVDRLPSVSLPPALPPLPAPRPFVEIVATSVGASTAASSSLMPRRQIFAEPARIPHGIPQIEDAFPVAVPAISGSAASTGISGAVFAADRQVATLERLTPPPEAAPVQKPSAVRLGGRVLEAKIIRRVMPEYPKLARDMRVSGKVRLVGKIGRDGAVIDLKVIEGHPLLVQSALAAVRQWLYSPTLLNGEPVEVVAPIEVNFTLAQ